MEDIHYVTTFRQYIGLKLHFDSSSSYEYKGHERLVRLTEQQLLARKDLNYFVEITRRYKNPRRVKEFFISMFLHDKNMWIGDMCDAGKDIIHTKRVGNLLKMDYLIESQLNDLILFSDDEDFKKMLLTDGDRPYIIKSQRCCDEVLAAVNKVYKFTDQESINPYWNEKRYAIDMYSKLLLVGDKSISLIRKYAGEVDMNIVMG